MSTRRKQITADWLCIACACVRIAIVIAAGGFFFGGADAVAKDVQWIRPRIGQRGTTVEVVIQGLSLAEPRELVFY